MKKIYNKNAREKQLLEEAYGAIYERRNPDSGTYDAEGELPGPIAELDPDEEEEHDEYHPGYGKVEGDFGNRNFKYLLKDVSELSSDPGMEDASSDDWRQRLDDIVRDYSEWRTVGEDEEDEPRRGISGYEHKPDALVSASKEKQKPYVSSYKDDSGERVFDVLDAHGTAVYRTGNKLEAWKWLKSNFDQLK